MTKKRGLHRTLEWEQVLNWFVPGLEPITFVNVVVKEAKVG